MRRLTLLIVILAMAAGGVAGAVSVTACGSKSSNAITIAVVPKGTTHEFWKSVHAGAIKAGRELGVTILWQGPLKEDDREDQIRVVDTLVSRGIQGLLLAPLDDKALRQPVANAVRAGVPVVTFDSKLESDDPASLVATSNLDAGKLAGMHMGKILGGQGNVIVMRLHEGAASTTAREQGFLDAVATFPGIKVVSSNQYAGALAEGAYRTGENLLASTRAAEGAVQGIFCPNESTTFGMLRALQNAGLAGKIKYVGFDSSDKLVQGVRDGQIDALLLQDPFAMGYVGVKTLVAHMRGEKVAKFIDTGATIVTRDNMNQPDIKERLQPNLDQYLK
ncbi:MAG: substrate-binding domain-containing protein [Acidobacteria bacterium]|nr:substrate-binding domain-containing protein [Acidobacteriota bacterium]